MNYFLLISVIVFCGIQGMNIPDSPRACPAPSPTCKHRTEQDSDMNKLAEAEELTAAEKIEQARIILEECAKKSNTQGNPTRTAQIAKLELAKIVQKTDTKAAKKLLKSVSESQLLGALAQKELQKMNTTKSLSQSVENN